MPKIIFTGTYNSKNKGDAAMEISTALALNSHFPDVEISIHSPFPEIDSEFYSPIPVTKCSRRRLIWGTLLIIRAWLGHRLNLHCLLNGNKELKSYADATVVVDLSGDMQTESYGPHVAYSHFIPLAIAIAMRKPVFLCAQSIGPFKYTSFLAKFLFNRVSIITVRDRISEQYLLNMKIKSPVYQTADMAFLLDPCPEERIDTIFQQEGIPNNHRPLLGVSVSGLIANHFSKKNSLGSNTDFYRFMAGELDEIIDYLDIDCVFAAHVTGPSPIKDDRIAAKKVKSHMKNKKRAHILMGDYSPSELKGVISRFKIHTGARMHASIAAVTSCVPVVSIAYSHKTLGVMDQFGLKQFVLNISNLKNGDLLKNFIEIKKQHPQIIATISQTLSHLKDKSWLNIKHIDTIINNNQSMVGTK